MRLVDNLNPIVVFDRAGLGYPGRPVLAELTFSIAAGEMVGIVGCSGSGKSTLLGALAGSPVKVSGSVLVRGRDPRWKGYGVGFVPQLGDEVLTGLSVIELVALGRVRNGLFTSRAERCEGERLLERLGLLEYKNATFGELSGGQRQRVAVARALMVSEAVLLCDEPTSGADPSLAAEIIGMLTEVAVSGTTVIVATHDLSVVAPRLDRLIGVGEGSIRYDGPATLFGPKEQLAVYGSIIVGGGIDGAH